MSVAERAGSRASTARVPGVTAVAVAAVAAVVGARVAENRLVRSVYKNERNFHYM